MRNAGTVPPASLVAASRAMVLRWKSALGNSYHSLSGQNAGGMVMSLEHAHRTFKALTYEGLAHLRLGIQGVRQASKHTSVGVHPHSCRERRRSIDNQTVPTDILL
jgi:hypothetical protein